MSTVLDIIDVAQNRVDNAIQTANNFVNTLSAEAATYNDFNYTPVSGAIVSGGSIVPQTVTAGIVTKGNVNASTFEAEVATSATASEDTVTVATVNGEQASAANADFNAKAISVTANFDAPIAAGSVQTPEAILVSPINHSDVSSFTLSTIDLESITNQVVGNGEFAVEAIPDILADSAEYAETIPAFDGKSQLLDLPDMPVFLERDVPDSAVELIDVELDLSIPKDVDESADLLPMDIPDPESIVFENYTIAAPEVDYFAPSNNFSYVERNYSSIFQDLLLDALFKEMSGEHTGIDPNTEQLLFTRTRDREAATYKDNAQSIARIMAARGFKMPPSAMAGLLSKAQDGLNKAMSGINREILLKRADLYVQARQFAITQGVQLETAIMSYHGAMMERSMNAAKLVADFGIQYHNLKVERYKTNLEKFKIASDVRTQWVDNAIKKTKAYELRLEKLKLVGEQNKLKIELQNSMNNAVDLANKIRLSELDVARFKLESNRMKLENAKIQTENYAEAMRGNMIAFQAYSEAVKAESMRNDPIKLDLEIHREERETVSANFALKLQADELRLKQMGLNIQRSEQLLQKYYKELEVNVSLASEASKRLGIELEAWKAQMDVEKVNSQLTIEAGKVNSQNTLEAAKTTQQLTLEASKLNAQLSTDVSKINAQLSTEVSKLNAQLGTDVSKTNAELQTGVSKTNAEIKTDVSKVNAQLKTEASKSNAQLKVDVSKTNASLKTEVSKANAQLKTEASKVNAQLKTDAAKDRARMEFDASKVNAQLTTEVSKATAGLAMDASRYNAEFAIDAQNKSGQLAMEAVKVNFDGQKLKLDAAINTHRVKIDAAKAGADLMLGVITGAQSALGTIATLAE